MIFLLYLQNNIETREIYKMKATKVLFIAQEITPYLPESEIANVCRYLPQGVQERGREGHSCPNTGISTNGETNYTK